MNNFTFGDEGMGYYETIAGGAGAGPGWHGRRCGGAVAVQGRGIGTAAEARRVWHATLFSAVWLLTMQLPPPPPRSGVHTHMTNTRITDPEILERRYPVVLHRFRLRPGARRAEAGGIPAAAAGVWMRPWLRAGCVSVGGQGLWRSRSRAPAGRQLNRHAPGNSSPATHHCPAGTGGAGQYRGGDGVVRELEFLRPLTASILSERRAVQPFGLLGGRPGAAGVNLWLRRDGRVVSLGGKATVQVGWGLQRRGNGP